MVWGELSSRIPTHGFYHHVPTAKYRYVDYGGSPELINVLELHGNLGIDALYLLVHCYSRPICSNVSVGRE